MRLIGFGSFFDPFPIFASRFFFYLFNSIVRGFSLLANFINLAKITTPTDIIRMNVFVVRPLFSCQGVKCIDNFGFNAFIKDII